MARTFPLCTLVILVLFGLHSPSLSAERETVSAHGSRIYFALDMRKTFERTPWSEDGHLRAHSVTGFARSDPGPFALIELFEAAPNAFFSVQPSLTDNYIFNRLELTPDDAGAINHFAGKKHRFRYINTNRDRLHCIFFSTAGGQGGGDRQISEGTEMLRGAYCNSGRGLMSQAEIETILNATGIKEAGEAPPSDAAYPSD